MRTRREPGEPDRIEVRGLVVTTIVGALAHEREQPQPLRVDLDLHVDLGVAGSSDDLADTANYGDVAERVATVVRESRDRLLERVATRVADVALSIERVAAVDVTVTKLRPPIAEHVETTGVTIHRSRVDREAGDADGPHEAIVALGSNLGAREANLRLAVDALPGVVAVSQVYETEPVGGPDDQGPYLNMVAKLRTALDPYALLRRCQEVEAMARRERSVRWGPRTLDVDIVFYDEIRVDDPALTIPHPRFAERRFVLAPLAEIAPERCPDGWDTALPPAAVHPRGPLP